MADDKIPTSKINRASTFLKTGLKVGGNYIKHYAKKAVGVEHSDEELERENAADMFEGFAELKGSALKVAQLLSMDTFNLSANFTEMFQKAQYSVPPMSAPAAIQAFKKSVGVPPEKVFDKFDPNAKAAASMGQVHEAYKDGMKLAVKIQYPGVAESIKSDLKMIKPLAKRIMHLSDEEITPYMQEMEAKLTEETNYINEVKNSIEFSDFFKEKENIIFPKYFPELSSNRVITMQWLEGSHMKEFLAANPTPEMKQKIGQAIWDFYEYQFHVIHKINADPHPGNFLFREDGSLGVLDFGCTKVFEGDLYFHYFQLANPDLHHEPEKRMEYFKWLEIIRETDKGERLDYLLELFSNLSQLIARPYLKGNFYFGDMSFYEEINNVGKEVANLGEIRGKKDFLFVNRTFFGIFGLLKELDVTIDTRCKYLDFFKYE